MRRTWERALGAAALGAGTPISRPRRRVRWMITGKPRRLNVDVTRQIARRNDDRLGRPARWTGGRGLSHGLGGAILQASSRDRPHSHGPRVRTRRWPFRVRSRLVASAHWRGSYALTGLSMESGIGPRLQGGAGSPARVPRPPNHWPLNCPTMAWMAGCFSSRMKRGSARRDSISPASTRRAKSGSARAA